MATVNLFGDLALDSSVHTTNDKLTALTATRDTTAPSDQKGIVGLAVRRDADTAPVVDGNIAALAIDEEGRLKTSNKTSSFAVTVGSPVLANGAVIADVRRASNVVFHVKNTGTATVTAGAFAFEASVDSTNGTDGTWFSIQAVRSSVNTVDTATPALTTLTAAGTAGAGLAWSWEASVNAYQYMRIRCTTPVTPVTTAITAWTIQRGSYATEPIPAAQTHAVTVTSGAITNTPSTGTGYYLVTAATTNSAVIRGAACNLHEVSIANTSATAVYVKLYNKVAAPTVGTDIPVITIPVPATGPDAGTVTISFGALGKRFGTGLGIAVTAAVAATDTAAVAAGIQISVTQV